MNYETARNKIYHQHNSMKSGIKSSPSSATTPTLPRVTSAVGTPATSSFDSKENMYHEIEKLKSSLSQKEQTITTLKQEVTALKMADRRQQKELAQSQAEQEEAPRLIQLLREEVTGLKNKLKSHANQHTLDERNARQQNENYLRLSEKFEKYKQLIIQNDLKTRDLLTKELEESSIVLKEAQDHVIELEHKHELSLKNLTVENQSLRAKLQNIERELLFYKDWSTQLEEITKDKDKQIASLSIYRYNAIHQTVCKECRKREKLEHESKKKEDISASLPVPTKTTTEILSNTSLKVKVDLPKLSATHEHHEHLATDHESESKGAHHPVTHLKVIWTKDLHLQSHLHEKLVSITHMLEKHEHSAQVVVDEGLQKGERYFFQAMFCSDTIEGQASPVETVLFDMVPAAPPAPLITTEATPPIIRIHLLPPPPNGGSAIQGYKIYHTTQADMTATKEQGALLAELDAQAEGYIYLDPKIGVPHRFRVIAINLKGSSEPSEWSDMTTLDCVPSKPNPPMAALSVGSSLSIMVSYKPMRLIGSSPINSFTIICRKANTGRPSEETRHQFDLSREHFKALATVTKEIPNLEQGRKYSFQVFASNKIGDSEISDPSDELLIDFITPTPAPPLFQYIPMNPTAVKICFRSLSNYQVQAPPLQGYRLYISSMPDLSELTVAAPLVPATMQSMVIEQLEKGATYWFAVTIVTKKDTESEMSAATCVHLAAVLPLPASPPPTKQQSRTKSGLKGNTSEDVVAPAPLPPPGNYTPSNLTKIAVKEETGSNTSLNSKNKLSLSRIDLSSDQKVNNMHKGIASTIPTAEVLASQGIKPEQVVKGPGGSYNILVEDGPNTSTRVGDAHSKRTSITPSSPKKALNPVIAKPKGSPPKKTLTPEATKTTAKKK